MSFALNNTLEYLPESSKRKLRLAGKYGLASAAAAPADLLLTLANATSQGITRLGTGKWGEPIAPYGYFSSKAREGLSTLPDMAIEPENFSERATATAADFIGGGYNKAWNQFKSPKVQRLFKNNSAKDVGVAGVAGLFSEMGREAFPESKIAPLVGAILPGLGLSVGAGGTNLIRSATKVDPRTIKAFENADLPYTLGLVSKGKTAKMLDNVAGYSPYASDKVKNTYDQIYKKFDQYNSQIDKDITGTKLQNSIQTYNTKGQKIATKLKERVDQYLPPQKLVETPNVNKFLEQNYTPSENITVSRDQAKTPVFQYMDKIRSAKAGERGKLAAKDLEYYWRNISDDIGAATRSGRKEEARDLTMLYNALKDDFKAAVGTDSKATKALQDYSNYYSRFARKRDEVLYPFTRDTVRRENADILPTEGGEKLITEYEVSPIESFDKLKTRLQKRPDDIRQIFSSLPNSDRKEFVDAVISELGKGGGEYSAAKLAKNYSSLPAKTKEVLLSNFDSQGRREFESVLEAINSVESVNKLGNTSRTAAYNDIINQINKWTGAVGAVASGVTGGWSGLGSAALLAATINGGSRLLTSPRFIKWASKNLMPNASLDIQKATKFLNRLAALEPEIANEAQMLGEILTGNASPLQETFEENIAMTPDSSVQNQSEMIEINDNMVSKSQLQQSLELAREELRNRGIVLE